MCDKIDLCDKIDCSQPMDKQVPKNFRNHVKATPKINTSSIYEAYNLPERFECPYLFQGYGVQKGTQNPFYRTTNSEYGYYPPNPHTVPTRYFPRLQRTSNELYKFGMYKNFSLNSEMDR